MTETEKAAFLSGKSEWQSQDFERLGIPSITFSDGPSGVRRQTGEGDHLGLRPSVPATCFPAPSAIANSWDVSLAEEVGEGLGAEAAAENVNVLLAPGLNIKRNPLCGRNFEYFSEDPYLSGKMAAAEVRGIGKHGATACLKHFAVNSQETRRMATNSVIDERTLREIYLTGFEIAVKEGHPRAVMSAYNEVNGVYANENRHLLRDILRDAWGFDGFVVSDWGGSNDHALGVKNGSNLEMPNPGPGSVRELLATVRSGKTARQASVRADTITQQDVDDRVGELLGAVMALHERHEKYLAARKRDFDRNALHRQNHALARRAAVSSMVLLKNENNILPLQSGARVAVIGDFAFAPRYQGAGSSLVNAAKAETVQEMIGACPLQVAGMSRGYRRDGREDEALLRETAEIARRADIVLLFFGLTETAETEGMDRTHLRIPENQIRLIHALAKVNPNLIGVISGGAAIEMPWRFLFKAILFAGLSGQAGAGAMLDILTGKANPSGKLSETFPEKYEDTPSLPYYPAKERNAEYREAVYVGYRYFDTAGVAVAYPFGFGLSYTTFGYSDLRITEEGVSFHLKNEGTCAGAEVAQLYVGLPGSRIFRPKKELKGFRKIRLAPGEEQEVVIPFDDRTFRYWNTRTDQWEIEEGTYDISVGASAADIRLTGNIFRKGTTNLMPYESAELPSYYECRPQEVSDAEFASLLGTRIPDGRWNRDKLSRNDAICQMAYAKSHLARAVCRGMENKIQAAKAAGKTPDLNLLFLYNMSFRAIAKMTGGRISMAMVDALLEIVNGHFFRGLCGFIGGYVRNARENKAYEKQVK